MEYHLTRPFELSTDASDTGFGCILSQRDNYGRERPVHYVSKTFTNSELSWHTRDKEAFAFIYALRKFRHYLLGRKFTRYTDHLGLRWLRNTKDPRGRYARWIEEIKEFDFDIFYRPGQDNPHADALSRRPDVQCAAAVRLDTGFSVGEIRKQQATDAVLGEVIQHLRLGERSKQVKSNPEVTWWMKRKDSLFLDNRGILCIKFRRGKKLVNQLVVPERLVPEVLRLKHDDAGHMSAMKTKKLILREYYWMTVNADVSKYCQTCFTCARYKGLEFDNSAMTVLAQELGFDKKRISALHPQANGAVERLNRTIDQMLKKELDDSDREWDLKIPYSGQVKSLHKAWKGPFIVIQQQQGNTYRVKNAHNFRQRFIRHCDQLRPIYKRPARLNGEPENKPLTGDSVQRTDTPRQTSGPIAFDAEFVEESDEEEDGETVPAGKEVQPPAISSPESSRLMSAVC
ncbi:Retrovirus-related Pol polyprotein from transposon 17.6 [Exaiptasia diaphana]|nr:Retrovirus-related Pol polyprotein from transposon 17.6 [Exaiptasia diaphana]